MKIIDPIGVTDAVLTASSLPENDYSAWSGTHVYSIGDKVIRTQTHRIYEALVHGQDATPPENAPTRWLDIGPTNKWASFDGVVGTRTSASGTYTFSLTPNKRFSAIAFLELSASKVKVDVVLGTTTIYSKEVQALEPLTPITNYYEYWQAQFKQRSAVIFDDLPDYASTARIDVTITGGNILVGLVSLGKMVTIGQTGRDFGVELIDYSIKDIDSKFGTAKFKAGEYRLKGSGSVIVDASRSDYVLSLAKELRATPVVFVIARQYDLSVIYGIFYKVKLVLKYPKEHPFDIQIEGLI